jgi:hypothetical protein
MPQYTLVLTETVRGQNDHANHLNRRNNHAIRRARLLGITGWAGQPVGPHDITDGQSPTGVPQYTWKVAHADPTHVCALVGLFNGKGFVNCPGPVPNPCTTLEDSQRKRVGDLIAEFSKL